MPQFSQGVTPGILPDDQCGSIDRAGNERKVRSRNEVCSGAESMSSPDSYLRWPAEKKILGRALFGFHRQQTNRKMIDAEITDDLPHRFS